MCIRAYEVLRNRFLLSVVILGSCLMACGLLFTTYLYLTVTINELSHGWMITLSICVTIYAVGFVLGLLLVYHTCAKAEIVYDSLGRLDDINLVPDPTSFSVNRLPQPTEVFYPITPIDIASTASDGTDTVQNTVEGDSWIASQSGSLQELRSCINKLSELGGNDEPNSDQDSSITTDRTTGSFG